MIYEQIKTIGEVTLEERLEMTPAEYLEIADAKSKWNEQQANFQINVSVEKGKEPEAIFKEISKRINEIIPEKG